MKKIFALILLNLSIQIYPELPTANHYDYTDCQFQYLKDPSKMSCVVEELEGLDYNLHIYDVSDNKIHGPAHKISVPSRYQFAKLRFEDVLGEGKKMIFIQVEGLVGKDTNQELLFIFHFQENEFKPVLFETISYKTGSIDEKNKLDLQFRFQDYGTKRVSIFLDYTFSTFLKDKLKLKDKKVWTDELIWDYKNHTFYDVEMETKKLKKANFYIEKNIHEVRLDFHKIQGKNNDDFKKEISNSKILKLLNEKKS